MQFLYQKLVLEVQVLDSNRSNYVKVLQDFYQIKSIPNLKIAE
ncbi:MAG: hypothetical protein ACTSQO_12970 [Candidatus Helarchaeota archaeon]